MRLVGSILTSGCGLHDRPSARYTLQFDYLSLAKGLLATQGETTPARAFLVECLGQRRADGRPTGDEAWVDDLLGSLQLGEAAEAFLYGRSTSVMADLTHQPRIVRALACRDAGKRHMVSMLPWGSGRSTAAFLASMHLLTRRMGGVLYVTPTAKVAELITRQAADFLLASGWAGALTLVCLTEGRADGERYRRLRWDDAQGMLVEWSDPTLIPNLVVVHPETLSEFLLQGHPDYREFLADVELVILDGADAFYGTVGTHVSLILRRLRLVLERLGADYRTFTTVAPCANALPHVTRLWGFDQDRETGEEQLDVIRPGEDFAPRPERIVAMWSPPLRFSPTEGSHDPHAPLLRFSTTPCQVATRDGLAALLSALAFGLAESPPARLRLRGTSEEAILHIPLLTQSPHLTEDDLQHLGVRGARFELVRTPAELRRQELDRRALVVFGHSAGWPELLHELAHFGEPGSLIVFASGPDPTSRHFIQEASGVLEERLQRFAAEGGTGVQDLWESGTQRLEFAPDNAEMLKLHLYLAATAEHGITDDEARRFFGHGAVDWLESLAREELGVAEGTQVAVQGKMVRRYRFAPSAALGRPTWDLQCVAWDRPGRGDRLLPIVVPGMGARPLGLVEKVFWSPGHGLAHEAGSIVLRQGRRLAVSEVTGAGVECRYANGMEWRPRLSRIEVAVSRLAQRPPRTAELDLMGLKLCIQEIEVVDQGVGRVDVPGYLIEKPGITLYQGSCARYATQGLFLRFGAAEKPSLVLRHSLEHLMKIVLPMFVRYSPEDLEVRVVPGEGGEWDLVLFDRHPGGTAYSSALWQRDVDWWRRLFKAAYDLLRDCPCHTGCWRCLKTFDCHGTVTGTGVHYNEELSKEEAFLFLGKHLDPDRYLQTWTLKAGWTRGNTGAGTPSLAAAVRQDGLALLTYHAGVIRRVLRDRCALEVPAEHQQTVGYDDASPTGGYCKGIQIRVWSPEKSGWSERQYIKVLAHEMTHFWQALSGQFSPQLMAYDFDNIEAETNIPFRGRLFVEGCAEWVCSHVCSYYGFAHEMSQIRQAWGDSEYDFGYRLFLFLEYHTDIARLLHLLSSGEILVEPERQQQGWRLLRSPRDYEVHLYNDPRLGLLTQMTSAGWDRPEDVQCLRRYEQYPHGAVRGPLGASQDAPRGSYILGRAASVPDEAEDRFKADLQARHRFGFRLDDPIGSVLAKIGRKAADDLALQCRRCSEREKCTVFQACHLHSSGEPGRSTTELLLQLARALKEENARRKGTPPPSGGPRGNPREGAAEGDAVEPMPPSPSAEGCEPLGDSREGASSEDDSRTKQDRPDVADARTASADKLDINRASRQEILDLLIVGPVLADRIVAARPYHSIDELRCVEGMSESVFELLKQHLEVR